MVLSLPKASCVESSTAVAYIKATNSTDATISTIAIFRIAITDSVGNLVFDTNQLRYLRTPQDIPPKSRFTHTQPFTVPAAGGYVLTLPEVVGSDSTTLGVAFESTRR